MAPKALQSGVQQGGGCLPAIATGIRPRRPELGSRTPAFGGGRNCCGSAGSAALLILALCLTILRPAALPAQETGRSYQTQYATLLYTDEKDLHAFTRNTGSGLSLFRESPERNPLLAKAQLDKMVETICSLMDMYPVNFRFTVTLYRTQAEVTTAYHRASAGANAYRQAGAAPIAFYAHATRSIAVAVNNVTDGILAHEIGHAVISAYFSTPPPGRMQEILCQYLDKHFRDNN
jgi:hypothetical protein